jgi:thiol-disulfide isomerase/thioredoxin
MKLFPALLALAVVALTSTSSNAAPQIGDKAPAIKVAKWMTKEPPSLPGDKEAEKHVFVVEFWATWCKPCWVSIPHLADLQKKYEKDGLIIIGISNEELDTIAKFIGSDKGGQKMEMPYFVGADDDMGTNRLWADDVQGIPYAFIVNKSGIVVWRGNPLEPAFDSALVQVLAGKYDIETAKKAAAAEKKYGEGMANLQAAYGAREQDKIFSILEELIQLKPLELQPYMIKRQMFFEFKKEDQVPAWNAKILEQFKELPESLRRIVEVELSKEPAQRDAALLIGCASRIIGASKDPDAGTLDLLARVQSECGMLDAAVETQTRAVAAASKEDREKYQKALDYYKTIKQLAKELRPIPTTAKAE